MVRFSMLLFLILVDFFFCILLNLNILFVVVGIKKYFFIVLEKKIRLFLSSFISTIHFFFFGEVIF